MPAAAAMLVAALLAGACSRNYGGPVTGVRVVASFYPLAWAAKQLGRHVVVQDLTPKGGEPHDIQLSASQRLAIEQANLVLLFGKGFQPDVEKAARDANGRVVDLLSNFTLLPSKEKGLGADPHAWLDPVLMSDVAGRIADALAQVDPKNVEIYLSRKSIIQRDLLTLDEEFQTGLTGCALHTIVTTHDAFGYLAKRYHLTELGLTGLTPEAEPSAAQIGRVRDAARRGEVGAIFYEDTDEGRRIGRSIASDIGVPALPLNTLESDPAPNDYLSQMRANLSSLEKGLRC